MFLKNFDKLGIGVTESIAGLFLLSTGDDKYLPAVKGMVMKHSPTSCGSNSWGNGYAGVLLGEYYLRTGDEARAPAETLCDDSARRQYYGGWSHGGDGTGGGYVCGGLMNPAGPQILTTLIFSQECGVEVN